MKTTTDQLEKVLDGEKKKTVTTAKKKNDEPKKDVVKAKPDAAKDLRDFFEDGLKDIYWAEKALTKALPKMAKNATASKLIHAFESHLKETEEHVTRLEKIFESLGLKAVAKKCDAMAGLLEKKGRERAERGRYGRYLLGRGFDLDQVEVALDRFFAV